VIVGTNVFEQTYVLDYISSFIIVHDVTWQLQMDNLHVRLNYNRSKEKGIKHHSKKEHNEISKIAKFGCEILYMFVLRAEIVTIFGSKIVIPHVMQTYTKFARLYFPYFTTFRNQILQFY
jgi:hypothetical protein